METTKYIEQDKSWSEQEQKFLLSIFKELDGVPSNSRSHDNDSVDLEPTKSPSSFFKPNITNHNKFITTPMTKVLPKYQKSKAPDNKIGPSSRTSMAVCQDAIKLSLRNNYL